MVIGLVGTELAIGKHSHAVGCGRIGEVKPLMGRDFESLGSVGAPLNRSYIPVIGRLRIDRRKREGGL